jgi:hypothetical protein
VGGVRRRAPSTSLALAAVVVLAGACQDAEMPTQQMDPAAAGAAAVSVPANPGEVVIYGTEVGSNRGDIYGVNLSTGVQVLLHDWVDPSGDNNSPNGVALDWLNRRLYFSVNTSNTSPYPLTQDDLYMMSVEPAGVPVKVGELERTSYSAAFFGGKYYYVPNQTSDLVEVSFNGAGVMTGEVVRCASFRAAGSNLFFGDIAIRGGIVYGSTRINNDAAQNKLFQLRLSDCAYSEITVPEPGMLQLAWGVGGTLYGHSADDGSYVSVDPLSGTRVALPAIAGAVKFSDIASRFDTGVPYCAIRFVSPAGIVVDVQDSESGIQSIVVTRLSNATVAFNPNPVPVGYTGLVTVTATKIDLSKGSRLELRVTDMEGNVTLCDPVEVEVSRTTGQPVSQTFTEIPERERWVDVVNGTPGVTSLSLRVNGRTFQIAGLKAGEKRRLDIASAMRPGDTNTITLTPTGQPGGSAWVLIHDDESYHP